MSKATTIQARIQPELKEMGDAILKKIGITSNFSSSKKSKPQVLIRAVL